MAASAVALGAAISEILLVVGRGGSLSDRTLLLAMIVGLGAWLAAYAAASSLGDRRGWRPGSALRWRRWAQPAVRACDHVHVRDPDRFIDGRIEEDLIGSLDIVGIFWTLFGAMGCSRRVASAIWRPARPCGLHGRLPRVLGVGRAAPDAHLEPAMVPRYARQK